MSFMRAIALIHRPWLKNTWIVQNWFSPFQINSILSFRESVSSLIRNLKDALLQSNWEKFTLQLNNYFIINYLYEISLSDIQRQMSEKKGNTSSSRYERFDQTCSVSHLVLFVPFNLKSISKNPHALSTSNQHIKAGPGPDWPPSVWTIAEILPIRLVCRAGTGKPHLSRSVAHLNYRSCCCESAGVQFTHCSACYSSDSIHEKTFYLNYLFLKSQGGILIWTQAADNSGDLVITLFFFFLVPF